MPATLTPVYFDTLDALAVPAAELEAILASPEYAEWAAAIEASVSAPDQPQGVSHWDADCPW